MRLVRKDNHEVEIEGTHEVLYAKAWIIGLHRKEDGSIGFDYEGGSDVWWDTQETVHDQLGTRQFVDANGEILGEDEIELIDETEEEEEVE